MGEVFNKNATIFYTKQSWYPNSVVASHITSGESKLLSKSIYSRPVQVNVKNGNLLHISHLGHTIFCTPHKAFHLKHVLYVPYLCHNLLSINSFVLTATTTLYFLTLLLLV